MPATTAIGTARIKGHGVATTSTDSARTGSPDAIQAAPAITSVTGMKERVPVGQAHGGRLLRLGRLTSRTMPAYVLSAAVATARRSNAGPR